MSYDVFFQKIKTYTELSPQAEAAWTALLRENTYNKGGYFVTIYVMMLVESYFKTFTKKEISDAHQATEVLLALDAASREEVQQTITKATELGGSIYSEPQDHGWMYQHSFADPDGHQWEIVYMDAANMPNCS